MIFIGLILWVFYTSISSSKDYYKDSRIQLRIVSSHKSISPGDTVFLAIAATISKGWHIYWTNPGDAGEPTEFIVTTNVSSFDSIIPSFPFPKRTNTNGVVTFDYQETILFPFRIVVPKDFSKDFLEINVKGKWLVCSKKCIPGKANFTSKITISKKSKISLKNKSIIEKSFEKLTSKGFLNVNIEKEEAYWNLIFDLPLTIVPKDIFVYPISEGIFDLDAKQSFKIERNRIKVKMKLAQYIWGDTSKLKGIVELLTKENQKKYYEFYVEH